MPGKFEKYLIPSGEAGARLEIVAAKPRHEGPYPKAGSQRRLSKVFADWITSPSSLC